MISDVAVVTDETKNESTIYVADERSGAIYLLTAPVKSAVFQSRLELSKFSVFFRSPELVRPSGLTYYNGRLIVCDRQLPAVFEIDTTTKTLSLLLKGHPLRSPSRVAVSQSGRVAVANEDGSIILYDRSSKVVTVERDFNAPVRLAFAGEDLLVLEKQGVILSVQAKSLETGTPVVLPVELPAKVGNDIGRIIDFAFLNGIYYVQGEKQVDAFIRSKGTAIQLFSQPKDSVLLSGISANKQSIVLKDSRTNTLWQMARPVPVTASFSQNSASSLIFLYQYLLARKTLPIRQFIATHEYKSFEELLLDQKITFAESSAPTDELVKFVCQLNGSLCSQSRASGTAPLNQNIRKGQILWLPDLTYAEVIGYESKDLAGRSVRDYLRNTFISPTLISSFTEDFLWSLNELSKSETLEIQLQSKVPGTLMAAPPRQSVPPGTVIKVGTTLDSISGRVNSCGVSFKYSPKAYNLITHVKNAVKGSTALSQLPRTTVSAASTKKLKQLGIDEVQYELDSPTVEVGDRNAIGTATALAPTAVTVTTVSPSPDPLATPGPSPTPDLEACLTNYIGPNSYLVVDAVKVKSGRYKIFKNNSMIHLSKTEIQALGLLGEADDTGEWSLVLNDPYYVAYRLSHWADAAVLQSPAKIITNPRLIRPGGTQDIFGLKEGSLLLPYVSQWQVTFLVTETELTDESSDFSKLKTTHKFTALRAEETARMAATMNYRSLPPPDEPLTVDTVKRNREDLKREINYPSDLTPEQTTVRIGIGEMPCSVDKAHPDFIDQEGKTAWITEPASPTASPQADPCVPPTPELQRRVKPNSDASDHGTHVAGLVGARSGPNSIASGLLPFSKLFLVDASSPSSIITSTRSAVGLNVFIFNFSFGLSDTAPELKQAIRDEWRNRLFVVAVDNDGNDLALAASPPVLWMSDIKNNMIGVGSSIGAAGTEYVLGDWRSADGQLAKGSAYGRKYVHLLAPGHSIFSTIGGNAYAEATGASQAAPQVTATAGVLFAKGVRDPERIKARLIYTADWFEQFRGKVWGGFLNMDRATSHLERNLVITQSDHNTLLAMKIDDDANLKMTIKKDGTTNPKFYNPDGDGKIDSPIQVPFVDILRITLLPDNTYRVIYLDAANNHQLKIVLGAQISGKFPCEALQIWTAPNFVASQCSKFPLGLDVSSVFDYVGKAPDSVTFEP
jgi:hypothetical protein